MESKKKSSSNLQLRARRRRRRTKQSSTSAYHNDTQAFRLRSIIYIPDRQASESYT